MDAAEIGCESCGLVWFDPGGTTGWSLFVVHPAALFEADVRVLDNVQYWECGQFSGSENEIMDEMLDLCAAWPNAAIGTEDFTLGRFSMDRSLLSPVRLNAALEYQLWSDKRQLWYQSANDAVRTVSDERLRRMKYARANAGPHAHDATRHALLMLMRASTTARKSGALRNAAWPAAAEEYRRMADEQKESA